MLYCCVTILDLVKFGYRPMFILPVIILVKYRVSKFLLNILTCAIAN